MNKILKLRAEVEHINGIINKRTPKKFMSIVDENPFTVTVRNRIYGASDPVVIEKVEDLYKKPFHFTLSLTLEDLAKRSK